MPNLELLQVGSPLTRPRFTQPGIAPALEAASINIYAAFPDLTAHEAKAWGKGTLRYGLYVEQSIPWALFTIRDFGDFSLSLNIHVEPQESRDKFFAGPPETNLLQLILVDWPTAIIRRMRAVAVDPVWMQLIKTTLFEQLTACPSARAVDQAIGHIESRLDNAAMMRLAGYKMRKL